MAWKEPPPTGTTGGSGVRRRGVQVDRALGEAGPGAVRGREPDEGDVARGRAAGSGAGDVALSWTVEPIGRRVVDDRLSPAAFVEAVVASEVSLVASRAHTGSRPCCRWCSRCRWPGRSRHRPAPPGVAGCATPWRPGRPCPWRSCRPVQSVVANQTKETLPVGVPPAAVPVTVALSWTGGADRPPMVMVVPCRRRCGVGRGLGVSLVASRGSQGLTSVL